jgi:hypothetical protein
MIKTEFMSLYEELSALTEEATTLDLQNIAKAIQDHFGGDTPGDKCIYIAPSGKFINLYPEIEEHDALADWLKTHELISVPEGKKASTYLDEIAENNGTGNFFADLLKYIQCRNDDNLCYLVLPVTCPTFDQYECLTNWLNESVFGKTRKPHQIEITCLDRDMRSYIIKDCTSEYLISRIKRCYGSGKLFEDLNN